MKRYCSVCFREITISVRGKICRHGFKKDRWVFDGDANLNNVEYKKVDSSPCRGSGKIGLTAKQLEEKRKK